MDENRILVAHFGDDVAGYLLYRERKLTKDVAVVHLAVASEHQRRGLARALVQGLLAAASDSRRVTLRCRNDYPAHKFWLSVGFEAVEESAGNSAAATLLTTFERRLQVEPSLFDGLYETSQPFTVDLDVLLDLATERPQGVLTRDVFLQLDQFHTHPVRTGSLLNELIHYKDDAVRARARDLISSWQVAHNSSDVAEIDDLSARVPGLDPGDRKHLADAEANGVEVLLTRDVRFERAVAEAPVGATQVRVVQPAAFVDQLMRGDEAQYHPSAIEGMRISPASGFGVTRLADLFVCQEQGEKKADLRRRLQALFASGHSEVSCLIGRGDPIAIYSLADRDGWVEVELLRVGRGSEAASFARHAVAQVRREGTGSSALAALQLTDPQISALLERALSAEGFSVLDGKWAAFAMTPQLGLPQVQELLDSTDVPCSLVALRSRLHGVVEGASNDSMSAATLEHVMDPLVVADSCLPAFIIPIQAQWSDRLLGVSPSQLNFDMTDSSLRAFREHVYFRSPNGPKIPVAARVFWYRTKDRPSRVFAMSTIDKVVVSDLGHIWGRFGGYGVLERSEIGRARGLGRVMAIRFVRSRLLSREVTLSQLQQAAAAFGLAEPPVPYAPRLIDPVLAKWLLGEVGVE